MQEKLCILFQEKLQFMMTAELKMFMFNVVWLFTAKKKISLYTNIQMIVKNTKASAQIEILFSPVHCWT